MQLQAIGPSGTYVVIGEVYDLTFDLDDKLTPLPVLGSRRIGARKGQMEITGTMKSYWINGAVHSMVMTANPVSSTGSTSSVYHSTLPNIRYNIRISSSNPSGFNITLVNVTFEKDSLAISVDKFVDESIPSVGGLAA